jgi:hypothetical protein
MAYVKMNPPCIRVRSLCVIICWRANVHDAPKAHFAPVSAVPSSPNPESPSISDIICNFYRNRACDPKYLHDICDVLDFHTSSKNPRHSLILFLDDRHERMLLVSEVNDDADVLSNLYKLRRPELFHQALCHGLSPPHIDR